MTITEKQLREEFPVFAEAVWAYLGLPSPDRLQRDIAEYLQHGPRRRFICGLRGVGKSYLTCAYSVWRGWNDSEIIQVIRSGAAEKAKDNVSLIRNIVNVMPLLRDLIPKSNEGTDNELKQIDGAFRFDWGSKRLASKDPSVAAYGITGTSVGSHPDLHIDDDIETPKNSQTMEARARLRTLAIEREKMLRDKFDGEIIILGTFQTLDSIYKDDIGVFDVRFYPAWYPRPNTLPHTHLAPILRAELDADPSLVDRPTLPERFPEDDLLIDEAQDKAQHALHMRLDPTLSDIDRHPLRCRNLVVMSVNEEIAPAVVVWGLQNKVAIKCPGFSGDGFHGPSHADEKWQEYTQSVMVVDPSGSGSDETAWCCGHMLNGNVFVSCVGGSRMGHDESVLAKIIETAKSKRIRQILVEPNFGDGMFTKLLQAQASKMGYQCAVEDGQWAKTSKMKRIIATLEPALNMHRVIVDHSVAADEILMFQMTHATREEGCLKHDDRLDAFADCVRFFTDQVAVDQQKRLAEARKAEAEAAVKQFEQDTKDRRAGRWVSVSMRPGGRASKKQKWF